ncbi:MAG TPA: S41 family peptidase [Phycisphaerales bacterium]|nr:S41 family peptidase [Phycisphaerales bacterium]
MAKSRIIFESALILVLGGAVLGSTLAISQRNNDYRFFDELIEIKSIISSRYVETPDEKALKEGAIKGMVDALNDPYTVYVPAAEKTSFNKDLTGEYVGIGATVNTATGWLTIVSPLEDSPAFKAGLMPNDRIIEIDGKSTENLSVDKCVDLLMGNPGTIIKLTVEREGERFPLEVTRDQIKTKSVKGFHRNPDAPNTWQYLIDPTRGIAYIRLTQFTPKCSEELLTALESLGAHEGRLQGLVLDLRGNGGGLLSEAESIADLFLEDGIIVSTRGRAFQEKVTRAKKDGTLANFPLALLINGQSASASEVLAGALVENHRAITVGSRTYGKGSVQVVLELPSGNGSELKLTEQGYFLPSGRSITRKDDAATWGVDPTEGFYVPVTDDELEAMFEVRRREEALVNKDVLGKNKSMPTPKSAPKEETAPTDWSNPESILATLKDPQLTAAVKAVQGKLETGNWSPTGQSGMQTGAIASAELTQLRLYHERLERELLRTEKRMIAIEDAVPAAKNAPRPDLWADTIDLKGGQMEIKDKDGKVVATLQITGNDLERWLLDADVKKPDAPEFKK